MEKMGDKNESFEAKDFGWLVAMSVLFFALVVVGFWLSSAPIGDLISRSFLNCSAITVKSKTRANSAPASNRSGYPRSASPIAASRAISATNGLRFFRPRSPSRSNLIR